MARVAPQPLVHPLDRAAAWTERALRRIGDARLAGVLLAAAAAVNLVAAHPERSWLLDTPAYLGLLGLVLASGIACTIWSSGESGDARIIVRSRTSWY